MERKKSLRVLAGIFLLIGLVFGLASILYTFFINSHYTSLGFFRTYLPSLIQDLILLAIVIFIFSRVFVGAGIAEGVLALWALLNMVSAVISLVKGIDGSYRTYYSGSLVLNAIDVGAGVLFMIGFFKHSRASKGLFILGAILNLVATLGFSFLPQITFNRQAGLVLILTALLPSLFLGSFAFLGRLFLGLYFGAQTPAAAQPSPAYRDPVSYDI